MWTTASGVVEMTVHTPEEVLALLEQLESAGCSPTMFEVSLPETGEALAIGVGADASVVTYQHSLDPPYFISLKEIPVRPGEAECVSFVYGGEATEYAGINVVPYGTARAALASFVANLGKPSGLQWEQL
jgi:hypothetical protein